MIEFPFQLPPSAVQFRKSSTSRSGGRSINGSEQVVRSDAGFWQATVSVEVPSIGQRGEDRTLAYRAFYGALEGMASEILVPCPPEWRPTDHNGAMLSQNGAGVAGGLNQLVGLAPAPEPEVTLRRDASLGDTEVTIAHPGIPPLRAGHFFGIGYRLYLIHTAYSLSLEQVTSAGEATYGGELLTYEGSPLTYGGSGGRSGENVQVLRFWPRLRKEASAGTQIRVSSPVCKMRLASDDSGALDRMRGKIGAATFEFTEVY